MEETAVWKKLQFLYLLFGLIPPSLYRLNVHPFTLKIQLRHFSKLMKSSPAHTSFLPHTFSPPFYYPAKIKKTSYKKDIICTHTCSITITEIILKCMFFNLFFQIRNSTKIRKKSYVTCAAYCSPYTGLQAKATNIPLYKLYSNSLQFRLVEK